MIYIYIIYIYTHAHAHRHIHVHIHTYTYTHTYTEEEWSFLTVHELFRMKVQLLFRQTVYKENIGKGRGKPKESSLHIKEDESHIRQLVKLLYINDTKPKSDR